MELLQKIKFKIRKGIFYIYARIKYFYPIWLFLNKEGRELLKNNPPLLGGEQTQILDKLHSDGIAVTNLEKLFPGENMLAKFQEYEKKHRENQKQFHKKKFFIDYLDPVPEIKLDDIIVKLMIGPRVIDVVNSYMGMFSQITYYTLQATVLTKERGRTFSQNWHRDPQEQRLCKVFVYLNDVDLSTGPFVYIPQSSRGHKYANVFPQKPPHGAYPDPEELGKCIPKNQERIMTGKAGTVVFCDTTGFHYGGIVKEKSRIMITLSYGAKTYRENKSYQFPRSLLQELKNLPPQSNFAINKKWMV